MGGWITGAAINIVGSVAINFGTNLLKLGHNQREKLAIREPREIGVKPVSRKSITSFQAWRLGVLVFSLGNCLNFISFGFAAQSLLAALGSVQFISNVGFAYMVLKEMVTQRIMLATAFIVIGNIFLVSFGNHESKIYTSNELLDNYKDPIYLGYCVVLVVIVTTQHTIYRYGGQLIQRRGDEHAGSFWRTMVPLSYTIVSGAIGTHAVLFAKSLSILIRLTLSGNSQLDAIFTYIVLFLFLGAASFWVTRLDKALAMFESILIVPMLQIVWTFFSICTGFIYFKEYRVYDLFRASVFAVGMIFLFVGMTLLAPQSSKGHGSKSGHAAKQLESIPLKDTVHGHFAMEERRDVKDMKSFFQLVASEILQREKDKHQDTAAAREV